MPVGEMSLVDKIRDSLLPLLLVSIPVIAMMGLIVYCQFSRLFNLILHIRY